MNSKILAGRRMRTLVALACVLAAGFCGTWQNNCNAQAPDNLSPELRDVLKLSNAQLGDDAIVAYVKNSGKSYNLSADDLVYLKGQGVSPAVLNALLQARPAAPPPAPASVPPPTLTAVPVATVRTPPPPVEVAQQMPPPAPASEPPVQEPSIDYFHAQLSPYGSWVNVGGVMYWHPDAALAVNPDWRPYYDMGQWVQTDNGLFWQSDYQWGDIPFHYGRWVLNPVRGWLWAPDLVWGPAWVFWRHAEADAAIGWAPLPFGAVFVDGGFRYRGVAVGVDFDFGLGDACFTFVGYDHFHEDFHRWRGHEWEHHIDRERMHEFYGRSVIRNEFKRDEHGRFVNNGIGHERIAKLTHVEHASFEERHPVGDRAQLAKAATARRSEPGSGARAGAQPQRTGESGVRGAEGAQHRPVAENAERRPATGAERPSGAGAGLRPGGGGQEPGAGRVFRPPPSYGSGAKSAPPPGGATKKK